MGITHISSTIWHLVHVGCKERIESGKEKKLSIIFAIWFIFCLIFGRKDDVSKNHSSDIPTENIQQKENVSDNNLQDTLGDDISVDHSSENLSVTEESVLDNETESALDDEEIVPHRTNDEIIGISDKSVSGFTILFKDSVQNDVTGDWRLAELAEIIDITEYALSYYQEYFSSDKEIHAVVNYSTNTSTCIKVVGTMLDVSTYEYVKDEQNDANKLFTGMLLSEHFIYLDNGDIEKVQ